MKVPTLLAILCGAALIVALSWWQSWQTTTPRIENMHGRIPSVPQRFLYSGSLGYWWAAEGLASLQDNIASLDVVTLYFYGVQVDGSVTLGETVVPETEAKILALAHTQDKEIILGINNFEEATRLDAILQNDTVFERHVQRMQQLVAEKGYDGIAIDYENLREDQTELFTNYIRRLHTALQSQGQILVVTVPTQRTGHVWDGIDARAIAPYTDRLELQTFEEHGDATASGAVASLSWVEQLISNALAQGIPAEKIIFGITFSGNDWIDTAQEQKITAELSSRDALEVQQQKSVPLAWDDQAQSSFFRYDDASDRRHTVWVEEARSARAKITRLKKYNLGGVFLWFIGGEDPAIWKEPTTIF